MGEESRFWKDRLASFDFEVTAFDWLLVIIDKLTGQEFYFHNDPYGVEDFINAHDYIYVGYNNKHYDNYILKGILNHYSPEDIKKINDWIIVEKKNGWEYPFDDPYVKLPPTSDLMLDMPLRQSLKELEGNMCMNIKESSIDFNIDHAWTKEEFEEMLHYCIYDNKAVLKLIDERMGYLEAKVFNGEREGLTPEESLYRTNGQLAAIALNAQRQEFNDERDIQFPDTVIWDNIPKEVNDFFNSTFDDSISSKDLFNRKLTINLFGIEWTFGWGGVHASLENVILISSDDYVLLLADVVSLYPSLMEEYGLTSRAVPDPNKFFRMKYERVNAKHKGDKKTANNLKVPINTVYGISLQEFSDCYDPRNGRSVCVTGQLLLTDLCVELCNKCKAIKLNNVNTDGVGFAIHVSELEKAKSIMKEWEQRTRLELEIEKVNKIILKDINNYILIKEDGSLKVKGGYVSDYKPSWKHNSLSIVATAIVKYFVEGKPVEETIYECDDPFKFQLIAKTGSTYDYTVHYVDGEEIPVQKVNRLYAVKNERYGVVKKVKKQYLTLDEDGQRRYYINQKGKRTYKKNWETDDNGDFFIKKDTTQNCPTHAIIDNTCEITIDTIDREWYISIAKQRINDFLGIKEENKMATSKKITTTNETVMPSIFNADGTLNETLARIQLYKKIQQVHEFLSKQKYVSDGYNSGQKYEYIKSYNYRELLGKACLQVGLLFKPVIANHKIDKITTKNGEMNLTTIAGNFCFIDPESGMHEDYTFFSDGADSLDKGIFKAETLGLKYFVLNTFLLPQQQDEIDPEQEEKPEKKASKPSTNAPATTEQRKEAKEKVVADNNATTEYVKQLIGVMGKIREVEKDYEETTWNKLFDCMNGDATISKTEAVGLMTQFEEKLDELETNTVVSELPTKTVDENQIQDIPEHITLATQIKNCILTVRENTPNYAPSTLRQMEDIIAGKIEGDVETLKSQLAKVEKKVLDVKGLA